MSAPPATLPLNVLDFVNTEYGESPSDAIAGAADIAVAAEAAGYRRYWVSEHHNAATLAASAPEILIAHLLTLTRTLRIGAAGIMLPNHAAYKVAESFRTLLAIGPDRVDLGLGRAPGTDPLTAHVLRRGREGDAAREFPGQVQELLGFLNDDFPAGHPYSQLTASPDVPDRPDLFLLGSSPYGPEFAAVNGMGLAFGHHQNPDQAARLLRQYRSNFVPGDRSEPWSAMSVLAFASDDAQDRTRFEAAWELMFYNMRRNIKTPVSPEDVDAFALTPHFREADRDPSRRAVGTAEQVVEHLQALRSEAEADEIVIITPGLPRHKRIQSYQDIAHAWHASARPTQRPRL